MNLWVIALGGALGALCRFLISRLFQNSSGRFPFGTFIVNIAGTFVLGLITGYPTSRVWLLFLGTGFCGAFTTFSTLHWEMIQLKQKKQTHTMWIYLLSSYICGFMMATLGYLIGKTYFS
ncbi:fluoride efflux transporter CrcB [Shimazuella kribbensis]|uniref:fluoride efflux transporter CrcB n=1 Tax=Shimazuella kribbensis TaxID=139808 RepID=UPI0003F5FC37|nr:fluoride efflux transporter CrcB [Shimazuella kribbensis]